MDELSSARKQIDRIDAEMAKLFEERMTLCGSIGQYKAARGLPIRDPAREQALLERSRGYIQNSDIESYYVQFLQHTVELSRRYQARLMTGMRVAYSGVEGAYAYIAAGQMFPDAELISMKDFSDVYRAVEQGDCDCGVLPLENSYAGEVNAVMDLLFSGGLYINRVIDLPVCHHLLGIPGADPAGIRRVFSHPQALAQCRRYLSEHGIEPEAYGNTAAAARYVRSLGDPTVAAIASRETAELLGLEVLDRGINDSSSNATRFGAFMRNRSRPLSSKQQGDESFILLFTVKNEAGALAETLNIIGAHGFNMKALRSRPMKELPWSYYFYVEAEGDIFSENGQELLHELSAVCAELKLAGAFRSDTRKVL